MDLNALIDEVCARVQAKIAASDKDRILILSSDHGTECHQLLEDRELAQHYQADCALQQDYSCDPAAYQIVVAYNFSIAALGKITSGILDDPYTKMFAEAVLAGKTVLLVEEEIELYRYQNRQSPYYRALLSKLELLLDSGVKVVAAKQLKTVILTGSGGNAAGGSGKESVPMDQPTGKKIIKLEKRVITEKDIITACHERPEVIIVTEKAILTALAREYAQKRNVEIRLQADDESAKVREL